MLISTSSRACRLVSNFVALGLGDLTLWPTELCLSFLIFAGLGIHIVPNGKVQNAQVFGPLVLAATASSWCWRRLKL